MSALLKIGDSAWWARCGIREVTHPCPVCFGKRSVRLELGNGEMIATPCDYCGKGNCGIPTGTEVEHEWVASAEVVTVTRISIEQDGEKQSARYHTALSYVIDDTDMFATKEEANTRCAAIIVERNEDERKRRDFEKEFAHKNFAWHVGYHRREAKRHREQLAWHEARAIACAALAKTPVPEVAA